jgi:hypothetical protein
LRTNAGKEKGGWDEKRKKNREKENRTECDSNELTIYNEEKKKIDDR